MTKPETRTGRVTTNLAPSVMERLDAYRYDRRWTRSTAVAVLVERGLDQEDTELRRQPGGEPGGTRPRKSR